MSQENIQLSNQVAWDPFSRYAAKLGGEVVPNTVIGLEEPRQNLEQPPRILSPRELLLLSGHCHLRRLSGLGCFPLCVAGLHDVCGCASANSDLL